MSCSIHQHYCCINTKVMAMTAGVALMAAVDYDEKVSGDINSDWLT